MRYLQVPLWVFVSAFLFAGCATQSVYLQNIQVDGPLSVLPLFVTDEKKEVGAVRMSLGASIAPSQSIEGRAEGHSKVNAAGVYQVDTVVTGGVVNYIERNGVNTREFEGNNFHWTLAPFTASVQADYVLSRSISLVGGMHYSTRSSHSFLAGTLGAGFSFPSDNIGVRVDLGAAWTMVSYDVEYAIATTPFRFGAPETYVLFHRDRGKSGNANVYGAFTLNTRYSTWPLQLFMQLAIYRQTVADVQRRTQFDITGVVLHHNSFFTVTPGMAFNLSGTGKLLLGIRLTDETALLVGEPGVLLAPFAQVEFGL